MTGVYRVHYDDNNWQALIAQLKENHAVSDVIMNINVCLRCFGLLSVNSVMCSN